MPSVASKILYRVMRQFRFNQILKRSLDEGTLSSTSIQPNPIMKSVASTQVITINNRDVFVIKKKKSESKRWIFYLHGGAYVHGFQTFHWWFLKALMKSSDVNIIAPDYPLLPNTSSQDMYKMIEATYAYMIENENPESMIFMGDSAGGGLALGFAEWLKIEKKRLPDQMILLSPWLDIETNHEMIRQIEFDDPILNSSALQQIGHMLSEDKDPKDYRISPLYGDFKDICDIHVITGTYDILYSDATRLKEKDFKNQPSVTLHVYESMIHTFMFFGLPESKQVIKLIILLMDRK